MTEITLNRGDSKTWTINVTNNSGTALDITGYTIFFTVKKSSNSIITTDSDALISKTITTHSDPTNGQSTLALSPTDTNINPGSYVYDIQVKDTSNNIKSSVADKFNVLGDVTRRTS